MAVTPDQVLDVIVEETSIARDKLTADAKLESLGIASLDVVSIIFTLEDRFGLMIETEDLKGAETLGDLVERVLAKSAPERVDPESADPKPADPEALDGA